MVLPLPLLSLQVPLFLFLVEGCLCGAHERRLLNDLLHGYTKEARPTSTFDEPVVVVFGLDLQQIIDMDEQNQVLTTNMWLNLNWMDTQLTWNDSEYGGVQDVRMRPELIWMPDILLFESSSATFDPTYPSNIVVTKGGDCNFVPPGIFKSTCSIDMEWFPFDEQACLFRFSSWTYDSNKLNLTLRPNAVNREGYMLNGEWDLRGFDSERKPILYEGTPYVELHFTLHIRRRTLYYFSNLILPCVIIASLAVFGFCVPPESGEKVTLEITVLMSLTFYMNQVSAMQPPSSATPLIGIYFSSIMVIVAASTTVTIAILNFHHRGHACNSEMPPWIRSVFLQWLPWILRIERPGSQEQLSPRAFLMENKLRELDRKEKMSRSVLPEHILTELNNAKGFVDDRLGNCGGGGGSSAVADSLSLGDFDDCYVPSSPLSATQELRIGAPPLIQQAPSSAAATRLANTFTPAAAGRHFVGSQFVQKTPPSHRAPPVLPPAVCTAFEGELKLILKEIKVISGKVKDETDTDLIDGEWKFAAMVLDRVCLITLCILTVVLSLAIFSSAPNVFVP